jgi:hypothetical protein
MTRMKVQCQEAQRIGVGSWGENPESIMKHSFKTCWITEALENRG